MRLATVLGYIVSVSTPAVVLSIYYIFFWDPRYLERFPANASMDAGPRHLPGDAEPIRGSYRPAHKVCATPFLIALSFWAVYNLLLFRVISGAEKGYLGPGTGTKGNQKLSN